MGIKQVKDGCWTFGDGDKVCYPWDVGGGRYVLLEQELEKLGFKLADEENDWFYGDDLDDTGVFRQTIKVNQTTFKNFVNTIDNCVIRFENMLGVLRMETEYNRYGNFFWVIPSGGGIALCYYSVQVYYEHDTNDLELRITLNTFDTANP